MFLKRIVLHGFKSFADRTEFEFGAGITAIVGPNGCGKSNILDAVRWVLGEQSARSLRGGKMQDVVFAGSRSRREAQAAHVQLTFDNRTRILRSDEDEVQIGRTLYRNGESEYRINGDVCRLKDIRDLFLDTGVGVDAYSVIEQGRVDMLLQANPLERRELFEEAAGISRYKVRRIEAQRRLERTQENLLRLQDILDELERRLRSVRLAAGKARNFQQYDTRLRELRSAFVMAEYHELEQTRRRVQQTVDELVAALQTERATLAAEDAEAAELAHARQALDEAIQQAEGALLESQALVSTLQERIAQGERRGPELAALRERRLAQVGEVAARRAGLAERVATEEANLAALRRAEEEHTRRIAECEAARRSAEERAEEARRALDVEKTAAFETVRRCALLQNEQENGAQQQSRLAAQAERLHVRRHQLELEAGALAERVRELSDRAAVLDQQSGALADALRAGEGEAARLTAEAERLDEQVGTAKESRSAVTSRLSLLVDLERRREGVDQGTRRVLAWREENPGSDVVIGLVGDLLRIDDPRVGMLQAVLATCETHVVVQDARRFLAEYRQREPQGGAVRAIALDRLSRAPSPVNYDHAPGFVARASDWVRCAPEHRPLAEHLLGRTFIVETGEQALRLAGEALAGCVFVALDGTTVSADGRVTAGAADATPGLISRKAAIRQLQHEQEEVESRLVQLTRQRLEVEAALSDLHLRREDLLRQIATLQREHAETRSALAAAEEARQRLTREDALLVDELTALGHSRDEIAARLEALVAERESADLSQREHEARIEALLTAVRERLAAVEEHARAYTFALVERGRATEKRAASEEALRELAARLAVLDEERAAAEDEAAHTAEQIRKLEREIEATREQLAARTAACDRQREETLALRDRRQQIRQRFEEHGAAVREAQRRVEARETELHVQQMALRETEVRKEGLAVRVREELALDLDAHYATYAHQEQDWDAIKAEIEELRGKIARLGHVNLDALAELEELTPRYEHLVAQRADLTQAIERLQALIVELDQESRARFTAAFEEIRLHFQEMFRKLFGGGKADVLLEDPENPLECGIEIVARPPGKEPRSISLLSGGEKTLTAVALLLGVFRSRPSPFAILDEVDAALDESNVERFNGVLQEFLSHSQFVVITHSKRTMACADVLYGVTMEEPGVSKRVSVRFDERVQAPNVA